MKKTNSKSVSIAEPASIGPYTLLGENSNSGRKNKKLSIGKNSTIRSHTVIYSDVKIGKNFSTGHHVLIRESSRIGDDVSVGSGSTLQHQLKIGNRVRIHSMVFIPEYTRIEDDVWIGPGSSFTNAKYPYAPSTKKNLRGPYLQHHCIIGANVTILPGIKIGTAALVGAGSVVTENIPAGAIVAGNPARIIGSILDLKEYKHLHRFVSQKKRK